MTVRVVCYCVGVACMLATAIAVADPHEAGKAAFESSCAVCHQASGAGNPALAPPLLSYPGRYATTPAGRKQLAMTLLYGLYGDVVVEDKHYNFKMPSFLQLDDDVIAETLNYVVFELAHAPTSTAPFTAADVAAVRAQPSSGAEVRAHRTEVLQALGL